MRWGIIKQAVNRWEIRKKVGRKTRRKEVTGKPKCRWENNIRMDLRKIGLECVD
jgi:hypothetical protein